MEMTGLDPRRDHILEIASIVTGPNLEILAEGPAIAVYQPKAVLALMDEWNQKTHTRSGLVERVRASKVSVSRAETRTLDFLKQWVMPKKSPICGSSIGQDRRFIRRYMTDLDDFLHYRCLAVSTVKEMLIRWLPDLRQGFGKQARHALPTDIRVSI